MTPSRAASDWGSGRIDREDLAKAGVYNRLYHRNLLKIHDI